MPQKTDVPSAVPSKAAPPLTTRPILASPQPAVMPNGTVPTPRQPTSITADPTKLIKGMGKGGADAYQQAMGAYIMGGLNLSMKGCIEGQGAVCSLLQKGCDAAKTYGADVSAEEGLLCQSVATVCPTQLDGFDIAASICLQKTVHVCDAVPQICQALAAEDSAACMQAFQSLCPQVGK